MASYAELSKELIALRKRMNAAAPVDPQDRIRFVQVIRALRQLEDGLRGQTGVVSSFSPN